MKYDVAIIGGGPAGSTVGSLLRLYDPSLKVVILEREFFPRDHIGESQLPAICPILDEMKAWDKVEAAGFPVKVGGTYRWGRTNDLWDLAFLEEDFVGTPRPSKFEGQRKQTAFQVDRSIYDKVLLDHAKEMGCKVYEGVKATKVLRDGDRITGLQVGATKSDVATSLPELSDKSLIEARYYVDASGDSALLRRTMGVEIDSPTTLRNIAIWDYWTDADWAVSVGHGGTYIQVMSIGWGWLWFIPVTPTRTSVGLVMPAERYKQSGKTLEEIYAEGIAEEPLVSGLLSNAKREGHIRATKDWSFLAKRLVGENWFLAGDSCGFADPILSAGMTLAHVGARTVAYTILELDRGEYEASWLKQEFDVNHRSNILQHIRFADFWYSGNGLFTELKDFCAQLASDVGLRLTADQAFIWIGTGGFTNESYVEARAASYSLKDIKNFSQLFSGDEATWVISNKNVFRLNLEGAVESAISALYGGRIHALRCFRREGKVLPLGRLYFMVYSVLLQQSDATQVAQTIAATIRANPKDFPFPGRAMVKAIEVLEAMITDGWVNAEYDPSRPLLKVPNFPMPKHYSAPKTEAVEA